MMMTLCLGLGLLLPPNFEIIAALLLDWAGAIQAKNFVLPERCFKWLVRSLPLARNPLPHSDTQFILSLPKMISLRSDLT